MLEKALVHFPEGTLAKWPGKVKHPKSIVSSLAAKSSIKTLLAERLRDQKQRTRRGSCHKRQKAQAPTPQAPIRN